ncbi:GspE/PulE family protein [Vibrio harveyi]|uniref:GspE/PulE family protein n=1 Tax=Vibrio harveyi TaxID=669 RepID=UPI003CE888C5
MLKNTNAELVLDEKLKSIYFGEQDTVALETGVIITTNFESPAIDQIKQHIHSNIDDFPELLGVSFRVERCESPQITKYIERISQKDESTFWLDDETASVIGDDAHKILQDAVNLASSDIHIELYGHEVRLLVRVDGRIIPLQKSIPDYEYGSNLIGYLFNQLAEDTDRDFYHNKPNNGRIELELTTPEGKRNTIWRISYIYAKDKGGQAVLRWLNKDVTVPSMDQLGWEGGHVKALKRFLESPSGACLIAGQVGSGKSTTIASALDSVKNTGRSINTLEDPVEFDIGIMQTSVLGGADELNELVKLLLRHDVDIEMHGEMRGQEGAMAVCRKAETGQLMFSTLHTSSAIGIAHTLHEQWNVPLSIISAPNLMKLWIYQTLVRTLCPHCKIPHDEALAQMSDVVREKYNQWRVHDVDTSQVHFRNPTGCEHCYQGEKGRTTLVEVLTLDDEDRQYILAKDHLGWVKALKNKGYKSVLDHANLKIQRGEIDLITAAERVNGLCEQETHSVYEHIFDNEVM